VTELRSEVFNNITYSKIPVILHTVIQKPWLSVCRGEYS